MVKYLAVLQYLCFIDISIDVTFTIKRYIAVQLIEIILRIAIVIVDEDSRTALLDNSVLAASMLPTPCRASR